MKKKILSFVVATLLIALCCLTLTACGEEDPKHTCEFETTWTKSATHHWHECKGTDCEEIADKAEHSWNDGVVTTPATASAKGVKTYTCTVCEQTKTEEVDYVPTKTVTEAEWNNAMSFAGITNYSMTTTSSGNDDFLQLIKVDGNKVYYKQVQYPVAGDAGASYYSEDVYVKDGTNYRFYSRNQADGNWADQTEYNAEYLELIFNRIQPSATFMMFEYSQFTYNASNGKYECASMTVEGESISNISLEFENGRIISGSFVLSGVRMNYSLSYEPCTVTVPTV